MRKQLKNINSLFAVALVLSVVLGCKFWAETSSGDSGNKGGNSGKLPVNSGSKESSGKDDRSSKSGLAKNIIGTWEGGDSDSDEKLTMTFNKDGSLDIETDFGDEKVPAEATYKIIDEQTVELKYSDGKTRKLTGVKVSGDTMQANGKNGKLGIFKRVS